MISRFELEAFIDGEFAEEERDYVLKAADRSVAVRAELEHLKNLKDLISSSYQDLEQGPGDLSTLSC